MLRMRSFFPAPTFDAASDAAAAASAAAAAAAAAKPWHDGADQETVGYFTARGWDKDAKTAAFEASKAHREAEKFIGAPASELIRLPKTATDPAWDGVWQRLGMPKEAKDYDFSTLKGADGKELDASFVDAMRETAVRLKLPKDRAIDLAQSILKLREKADGTAAVEHQAKLAQEKDTLSKNWGLNKESNMFIAKQAAGALGVTPEAVNALENQIGYAALMNMFLNIGQKIGEDKFIRNDKLPGGGVLTKEQAVAKRAELLTDTAWKTRYQAGGQASAEYREMMALQQIITGVSL